MPTLSLSSTGYSKRIPIFEFEYLMENLLLNLGYDSVRQAPRTADEG
jgi:hypothetical protein